MAPAGGRDAGTAALQYGANAIYLGLKQFSARADAENFSLEDVDAITAYAHSLQPRRKVFAAVNTLVLQDELHGLADLVGSLADIGVDAVIVQDLGVFRLVRRRFPELRIHASTQMAVHNREGVEALRRLGFHRVTLARELSLAEIREIAAGAGVETEVFVHGALCYSYSGLCLFSSMTLGRSGNRGRCAYLCRDRFAAGGGAGRDGSFLFSMKDLALPDQVSALAEAGVTSFKIEGRKKSPLYVAATVGLYRGLIDGTLSPQERRAREADIQSIFSRPWTTLHVGPGRNDEVIDPETVGHRGAPIGTVESVRNGRLVFRTRRAVERHDGLQIDIPGMDKPFGFGIDDLRIAGHGDRSPTVFEAPAGSAVEVTLPPDYPRIPEGAPVYCSSSQDVKRRYRFDPPKPGEFRVRRPMIVSASLEADRLAVRATVPPRNEREPAVTVEQSIPGPFAPAKDPAKTAAAIRAGFEKLGETGLALDALEVSNPAGLFVPVSQINQLRRDVTAAVEANLARNRAARVAAAREDMLRAPRPAAPVADEPLLWSLKVDRADLLAALEPDDVRGIDEIVVEIAAGTADDLAGALDRMAERAGRDRIRLALPIITRRWEADDLKRRIERLRGAGWRKWEAANVSAWGFLGADPLAPEAALDLSADWSVYVLNRFAAEQAFEMGASRVTLSPEDGLANLRALLAEYGPRATVIVHQDTPLFISESCVHANAGGGCPGRAKCDKHLVRMRSSHGDDVLAIDHGCRTILIGEKPYCLAGRIGDLRKAGARAVRADFMYRDYSAAQVRDTWRALRAGRPVAGHLGNFDRGLL